MTSLKYHYLEHTYIASDNLCYGGGADRGKNTILLIANTRYSYCIPYIILLTLTFMYYKVQSGYSEGACQLIDQRLSVLV